MLVAALVSGFVFQAWLNPPGGVVTETRNWGKSILVVTNHNSYKTYFTLLIIALVASISVVACMVSGFPLNRRITVLLLRLVTWVSLMAMVFINVVSVTSFTRINIHGLDSVILKLRNSLFALSVIMGVILCAHIVRLVMRRGGRGQRVG